uniref:DUF4637 domain-containing protein n=1 Tax=Xenopus tropicalis TaxID=8364 RepID=A0A6I8SH76_XENTR
MYFTGFGHELAEWKDPRERHDTRQKCPEEERPPTQEKDPFPYTALWIMESSQVLLLILDHNWTVLVHSALALYFNSILYSPSRTRPQPHEEKRKPVRWAAVKEQKVMDLHCGRMQRPKRMCPKCEIITCRKCDTLHADTLFVAHSLLDHYDILLLFSKNPIPLAHLIKYLLTHTYFTFSRTGSHL